eukprot:CAMPEP_0180663510 /NCGR_PEP_ID=MMETSP1037_2-20121125/59985_1 /TAXON_ID=632150 /ORGANISM="Azadinium spinosum, Strain 3D9" /LENGTH=86 /DNA_ID=CAMNT_0022691287 /DNA_START=21 /DNA_END=277 /DNA_ORIENTATION=-
MWFISGILWERRDIELDSTEEALWESTFIGYMTKVQMRELLALGQQMEKQLGQINSRQGQALSGRMLLVVEGQVLIKDEDGEEEIV